jgi:hypothetical protein
VPEREVEPGYGAAIGLDLLFGRRWGANLSARYLESNYLGEGDREYWGNLGLTSAGIGVAYRF